MKGLEPPRLSAPDPKSGAATNYATSAFFEECKYTIKIWIYNQSFDTKTRKIFPIMFCLNIFTKQAV